MTAATQLLVFRVDDQRYALPLDAVECVLRAAAVTPLPGAPDIILGAVDVHGDILPVLNVRRRFRMPERDIHPADSFLLAVTGWRRVLLAVDGAEAVITRPTADIVESIRIAPGVDCFPGVMTLDDGLVLIHDVEKFLTPDEQGKLDQLASPPPRP